MRYFIPHFQIATLAEPQTRLLSKIGGLPWGYPLDLWPHCCGQPQRLLAQLQHEPPMLDLGDSNAVLHLFQCLECGGIDDCGRGSVLLERSQLSDSLTTIDESGYEPTLDNPLIGELWIDGWTAADDGIPCSRLTEFFRHEAMWTLQKEFTQIDWYGYRERTKFGGTPRWTGNGPMGFPTGAFEFAFQIDNDVCLIGKMPKADEVGCYVSELNSSGSDWITTLPTDKAKRPNAPWGLFHEPPNSFFMAEFTNLGSDGTIYVFIDRSKSPHEVLWFWNR